MGKKIIDKYTENIDGAEVTILTIEPKQKKVKKYADRSNTTCPNCQSILRLNTLGQWECAGDKIKIWEKEFYTYMRSNEKKKVEILANFSNSSRFLELYEMWHYDIILNEGIKFDCGYTNEIFPLISACKEKIPDPLFVKIVESKLGRKLTEEELLGESELYWFKGMVLKNYKKNSRVLRIPWIILPNETETYV